MLKRLLSAACAIAAITAGCSTFKVPTERLVAAEGTIRAADEVGAGRIPAAAYQIQLAKDEAERAKKLIADGENERAHNLLLRAQSDAELALALAREAPERAQAQEAMNRARSLQTSAQ